MAKISVERAHTLGKEAAREKADKLAKKLNEQYGLEPQWSGDTLNLKRSGVKGEVHVADDSIRVDVELGLMMSAMSTWLRAARPPAPRPCTARNAMRVPESCEKPAAAVASTNSASANWISSLRSNRSASLPQIGVEIAGVRRVASCPLRVGWAI